MWYGTDLVAGKSCSEKSKGLFTAADEEHSA